MMKYPHVPFEVPNGGEACFNLAPTTNETFLDVNRNGTSFAFFFGEDKTEIGVTLDGSVHTATLELLSSEVCFDPEFPIDLVNALLEDLDSLVD